MGGEICEVRISLAMMEMVLAHQKRAERLAREALKRAGCNPWSRVNAHIILAGNAMIQNDWKTSELHIRKARRIAPASPDLLIFAAKLAHFSGRPKVANEYLSLASRLAPKYQGVIEAKKLLMKKP